MSEKFKVGSLYAGIGGICLGFKNSGFDLLWANEFDKNACRTYRENFKHNLIEGDVLQLDLENIPKVDILTAGFPCQPFSLAGYRKGFNDHRGNHFFRILDFVDTMRPKVLFLENVKNLVNHDKGNTMKVIESSLRERNYSFQCQVLNTKDYGNIPHNRERIFMIAFDTLEYPEAEKTFKFPKKEELTRTIKDVIVKEKVADKFYYNEDRYMFEMLKEAMKSKETVYQFRRRYVRENKSNVCPTLTANMGTGGHNVPLVLTDYGFRKLTPRECLRFQGFPDSFKIPVKLSNSNLYKQAGNSVSVSVIEALSKKILEVLEKSPVIQ